MTGQSEPPRAGGRSARAIPKGVGGEDAGSRLIRQSGRRTLREYPLTEGELNELAALSLWATSSFSIAGLAAGFVVNVTISMAFSTGVPSSVLGFWNGLRLSALIAAVVFGLLGIALLARGHLRIREIKSATDHSA